MNDYVENEIRVWMWRIVIDLKFKIVTRYEFCLLRNKYLLFAYIFAVKGRVQKEEDETMHNRICNTRRRNLAKFYAIFLPIVWVECLHRE